MRHVLAPVRNTELAGEAFGGAPISQVWTYRMGEGEMFTASYVWDIAVPDAPVRIEGIIVGRVRDGVLIEEWGANQQTMPAAE